MASATSPNSFSLFSSSSSSSSHHRPSFHVASSPRLHVGGLPFAPLHRLSFSSISIDPLLALHAASRLRAAASVARLRWRRRAFGDLTAADLKGKNVFLRADLNVPLDENQHITDDTRVRVAIPTIKHLIGNGVRVILSSHLVEKADDCIGPEVETMVAGLPEGGVLLLENVRFYKEEEKNEPEFAKKTDSLADLYVNDAFGTAQRAHASTEGVTKCLKPSVAGFFFCLFLSLRTLKSENNLCLQKYQGAKLAKNSAMFVQGLPLFLTLPCFVNPGVEAYTSLHLLGTRICLSSCTGGKKKE